jgi:hypothetical protein
MTPVQKTLARMDAVRPGRFYESDELTGFLAAHSAFARRHMNDYVEFTPEYVREAEAMYQRAVNGATYEDIMKSHAAPV